ncbi:MAG: ATP-binding cassette domain-containing protein [Candidatus Poribacteria bacterium]|nr:ATP-binding cassette domain-containing protein [Candidatus Poribacteria bacterium]
MIEVNNLSKNYGPFQALKEISFSVDKGQIVGFLGPNGAGKTTTMRILTCFMPASKGKATVAGYDVFKESREVRKRIGYLPENIPLYNEMTVSKYLTYMAKIRSVSRKQINEKLNIAIESCGLSERRNQIIGQLSRGFRQRVGLAQALIHDPEVLILDEPTSGLDPRQIVEIRELIKSLGKERTILFSTHILPEARMTCERLLIISNGKITGDVSLSNGSTVSSLTHNDDRIDANHKTLTLELSGGEPDIIIDTLINIPHVLSIEQSDEHDSNAYYVQYEIDKDVRPEVAKTVVDSGWDIHELRTDEIRLEELFLSLTSEPTE